MLVRVALIAGAVGITAGHFLSEILKKHPRKTIANVRVGDDIQWESNGAFVFEQPRTVTSVTKAESGIFVFVEEGSTGIPVEQVVVIRRVGESES